MWIDLRAIARDLAAGIGRALVLALILLAFALLLVFAPVRGAAQADGLEELAAGVLARYGVNEAGLEAPGDMLLIWQVAETHADTLRGRVSWLRRTSRCVVARRAPTRWPRGNCRWARFLAPGPRPPRHWPLSARRWHQWAAPRYELQLDLARRVVAGEELARPCDGRPQTWDGWRWHDRNVARGFRLVPCADPWTGERLANAGYRYPRPSR